MAIEFLYIIWHKIDMDKHLIHKAIQEIKKDL